MKDMNKIQLVGYVGDSPQITIAANGSKRANLRVATHSPVRKGPEQPIGWTTIWHNVVTWDRGAQIAEQTFVKGSRILVEGRLQYRNFEGKDGHTRQITEIKADKLLNLDR